jgi:D-alanine-D-alanine ligase
MRKSIAIIYNKPVSSRYDKLGENKAITGVLNAVSAVHRSLLELGYKITCLPLTPPIEQTREILYSLDVDLVFNLFEGFCGKPETEALIPEYLEDIRIPYTGCPARTLTLCLDKAKVKLLLQAAGIQTPDFQLLNPDTLHTFRLNYPCIVKPRNEDASHGIDESSIINDSASLLSQVQKVDCLYGNSLVEEFITGPEFNVTIIGNSRHVVLPISEIQYSLDPGMPEILTYAAKWETDSMYYRGTNVICPAYITIEEIGNIQKVAKAAFKLLGCRGYARIDMRMDRDGILNVIEVNPNPDISPDAGTTRQAKAAGMSYTAFIEKIVRLALEKENNDNRNTPDVKRRQAISYGNIKGYAGVQTV